MNTDPTRPLLRQTYELSEQALFQEISGEAVLLDLDSEHYFGLDEVGTRIWQLLDKRQGDLGAVFAELLAEYDVDEATLYDDLTHFVGRLVAADLARPADAG